MANDRLTSILLISLVGILLQGCSNKKGSVWDQNKSAVSFQDQEGGGWGSDGLSSDKEGVFGPRAEDFVALSEEDLKSQFADDATPQSSKTPGDPGSGIPDISHFKTPLAHLASIFRSLYFNTNEHVLRSQDSINILEGVARYMKENPNLSLFIEGHCDERGPEAYNLSLGSRRANYVRSHLVKAGVSPERIFTVSYGKERPLDFAHNPRSWAKNRRAAFKIYTQ